MVLLELAGQELGHWGDPGSDLLESLLQLLGGVPGVGGPAPQELLHREAEDPQCPRHLREVDPRLA